MEIDLDSVLAAKGTAKDDPRLKRKISTKHRNIIAGKIDDWKSCAAYLEVSDQDVDDIVEENRRVKHQRSSMLRLWWETNGNEATYLRLAKALARIDRRDLIEELLSMMASQSNQQSINVKGSKTLASSVCNLRWITCEWSFRIMHLSLISLAGQALIRGERFWSTSHQQFMLHNQQWVHYMYKVWTIIRNVDGKMLCKVTSVRIHIWPI